MTRDDIDRQAVQEQRADIDAALPHIRALVALTARMKERNRETARALGGVSRPSNYFHPVLGVSAVGGLMARLFAPELLRRVEVMLGQLDSGQNG